VFSNEPYGLVGTTTILPVKFVLRASIAERAASESPKITNVLGSILALLMNCFLEKAGICSGIISYSLPSLYWTKNDDIPLNDGPWSTKPLLML
jgi:hypothetical protein